LIGKYAVRSVGFGNAGVVTRAEGFLMVDIFRDNAGKLMMREETCWSAAYTKATPEKVVTTAVPDPSVPQLSTTIELDITGTQNLVGAKEWVRGKQPADQNVAGWLRGRPSYCPPGGGPADPSLPGYGPANGGVGARGALKPWLKGAVCLCPSEEVDKRLSGTWLSGAKTDWCNGKTGADKTACVEDWAQNHLPYSPGGKQSEDMDVTDCRVVDDDGDGRPAVTGNLTVDLGIGDLGKGSATVRSATVTANMFWGKIDTSAAKQHWGVSQDQKGLQSANVACPTATGIWGPMLCGTSSGTFCPAYNSSGTEKSNRLNPVDFVSLHDKTAPAGGWTCAAIAANRTTWFSSVQWDTRYPSSSTCNISGN
jgi:hypothetical protein